MSLAAIMAFADSYRVTANELSMRYSPSKDGEVAGVLIRGQIVEVDGFLGEWARLVTDREGEYLYVATQYLDFVAPSTPPTAEPATIDEPESDSSWLDPIRDIDFVLALSDFKVYSRGWLYATIVLLLIFGGIVALEMDDDKKDSILDSEPAFYVCSVLFMAMCACELMYFGFYDDATWFCSPHEVGWIVTIIDFFLFCGAVWIQIMSFILISGMAHFHGGRKLDCIPGLIATGVAFVAILLADNFWEEYSDSVHAICLVALALWLLWMVYVNVRDSGSWLNLLWAIAIWCVGALASMIMLLHLLVLMIVAAAIALAICIFGASGSGSSSSADSDLIRITDSYGNTFEARVYGNEAVGIGSATGRRFRRNCDKWEEI